MFVQTRCACTRVGSKHVVTAAHCAISPGTLRFWGDENNTRKEMKCIFKALTDSFFIRIICVGYFVEIARHDLSVPVVAESAIRAARYTVVKVSNSAIILYFLDASPLFFRAQTMPICIISL